MASKLAGPKYIEPFYSWNNNFCRLDGAQNIIHSS